MNYRVWGIPALLLRGIPGKALRAFPGSFRNFFRKVPDVLGVCPSFGICFNFQNYVTSKIRFDLGFDFRFPLCRAILLTLEISMVQIYNYVKKYVQTCLENLINKVVTSKIES